MATDLILGTAGHIDHGKTSLIRALTGTDTDRLPDEKRRGITIDLGFAELELGPYRLGIVDVPGHERFIRNMLAGATGTDLALLVVAADDSVKPQTREHLEILRLLDITAGVIALTKCDLADPDWMELVEEEIRELVRGTFLEQAPIVRTSTVSQDGIPELRDALLAAATRAGQTCLDEYKSVPFRMAIDRTFTIAGHGTVVTGSVSSGAACLGDEMMIEPGAIPVRIRGLQNHDRAVENVRRGQRAAVNLVGVHHRQVQRGHELTTPGQLKPSKLLTTSLTLLASAARPLKSRSRIRLHIGTAEVLARVNLLGAERLEPGGQSAAQLYLNEPCVTAWSQPFILRRESPMMTIGGGQVLAPHADPIRQPDEVVLKKIENLTERAELNRASASLFFTGLRPWRLEDLAFKAGIQDAKAVFRQLIDRGDLIEFELSPTRRTFLHREVVQQLEQRIEATLRKLHNEFTLRSKFERAMILNRFAYLNNEPLIVLIMERMRKAGRLLVTTHGVSLVGCGPQLSQNEKKLHAQLVTRFRESGLQPPSIKDCQQSAAKLSKSVPDLIALATADGELVEISRDMYLHTDVHRELRETLRRVLASGRGITISEIREILETTRKYAVPLAEYLDRTGFTRREGDLRVLAK